ncbi:MAG TPA: type II secretion system protein GspM [Usitatibacter sp.]|nr:type II secretion system protein GspM [Usitatibacter sp.]
MAIANLSPDRSRRLAIGLLVLAIVLAIAAVAVPVWMRHRYYDAAMHENLDKLDRYRRIASTRPEVTKQLEAMRGKESRKFFLRSGAAAFSAAEAQEAVRAIVESNGGRLITMQAPSSRDEGRYRQVTVNVQLTANIFALRKIIATIEGNTPFLFVDNMMIRSQVPANHKPGPGQEPDMFVTLDVTGYALVGS